MLAELIAGLQVTLTILLPAQLLDRLAGFAAFLLGSVAIPITSAKLALSVAAPTVTVIVTAVITTTIITTATILTAMLSVVMVAATFLRRVILVMMVRILLLALALALALGAVVNIYMLLMIEHIIMITFGLLTIVLVIVAVVLLGRISMAIANDWVHPQEFHL